MQECSGLLGGKQSQLMKPLYVVDVFVLLTRLLLELEEQGILNLGDGLIPQNAHALPHSFVGIAVGKTHIIAVESFP